MFSWFDAHVCPFSRAIPFDAAWLGRGRKGHCYRELRRCMLGEDVVLPAKICPSPIFIPLGLNDCFAVKHSHSLCHTKLYVCVFQNSVNTNMFIFRLHTGYRDSSECYLGNI